MNLAVGLTRLEQRLSVGLLDADVYGPSIPKMMNLSHQPELSKRKSSHTHGIHIVFKYYILSFSLQRTR